MSSIAPPTFGSRLAEKRKERELTQEQLGDRLGVGKATVSAWEVGRNQLPSSLLPTLCACLQCSADELLGIEARAQ